MLLQRQSSLISQIEFTESSSLPSLSLLLLLPLPLPLPLLPLPLLLLEEEVCSFLSSAFTCARSASAAFGPLSTSSPLSSTSAISSSVSFWCGTLISNPTLALSSAAFPSSGDAAPKMSSISISWFSSTSSFSFLRSSETADAFGRSDEKSAIPFPADFDPAAVLKQDLLNDKLQQNTSLVQIVRYENQIQLWNSKTQWK